MELLANSSMNALQKSRYELMNYYIRSSPYWSSTVAPASCNLL